jgi:hypothetical protein
MNCINRHYYQKNFCAFFIFLFFCCTSLHADRQEKIGRSFMFTRPLFAYLPLADAGWHELIYKKTHAHGACLAITPAYQHSTKSTKINRYFSPAPIDTILVAGDQAPENIKCKRGVRAEWLQLAPTYVGQFHFNPIQSQAALIVDYNQDLWPCTDTPFFKDTYISISLPIVHVKNNLELVQCGATGAGTEFPTTLSQAFANPAWHYAKIAPKKTKTTLGELKLRWGMFFLQEEHNQFGYYFGLSLPTSKKQNPVYWFDAVAGYDGHLGINGGIACQFLLNRNPERCTVCFFANFDDVLLVKNHQIRTFDLKEKPWSRFLLFNSNPANSCPQTNIPGVNVLTRKVAVHPYNVTDFSAGWRVRTRHCEWEIGYNLWGHAQENLKLYDEEKHTSCCPTEWGIAGLLPGTTASKSTIANRIPKTYDTDGCGNPLFIPIKDCDIDVKSAAASSSVNHAVHMSLSVFCTGTRADGLFSVGLFAEYPQRNSALQTWGIWGKIGASF